MMIQIPFFGVMTIFKLSHLILSPFKKKVMMTPQSQKVNSRLLMRNLIWYLSLPNLLQAVLILRQLLRLSLKLLLQSMLQILPKLTKLLKIQKQHARKRPKKINKLIFDAQSFMSTFQTLFGKNIAKANAFITSLGTTLWTEKDALEKVCTSIQPDNTKFQTSLSSKICKLHEDLAMEKKITNEELHSQRKCLTLGYHWVSWFSNHDHC